MNKKLSAIAVLACIAISAGIASAQQLGAFNQTNVVNSNPTDNIDLSNSTLNLNINGENLTISNQQTPAPTTTPTPTADPPPNPQITVTLLNVGDNDTTFTYQATVNDPSYYANMTILAQNLATVLPQDFYLNYGLQEGQFSLINGNGTFTVTFFINPNGASSSNPNITASGFPDATSGTGQDFILNDLTFYFGHNAYGL